MSRESLVLRDTEITPQRVVQSVGTQLQDITKTEDEIRNNRPLAVLFSHSSRIRCFLDLLYPANNPSKSIYQLMKDYKNTYGPTGVMKTLNKIPGVKIKGELDIDFKFYNCVVFVLINRGEDYYLCMKHEGIPIEGEKERIGLSKFRDLLLPGISVMTFDTNTYIKVEIKEPKKTAAEGSRGRRTRYYPSGMLKQLLNKKHLCIIRHGQSTHNAGQGHGYTDTSLTRSGVIDAARVAHDILHFFLKQMVFNNEVLLYVSELFRTQQTAMIFVNILTSSSKEHYENLGIEKAEFTSTASNPIQLIVVPCNHEFSESKLGSGGCYKNQSERANWFQNKVYKKENVPEHRPEFKKKRINVTFQYLPNIDISYFHLNNTYYENFRSNLCKTGVFYYMNMDPPARHPAPLTDESYTEMSDAAGYRFRTDKYVKGRNKYLSYSEYKARKSWESSGGSLKKKRKRRTIRRKSKRFTKKRFTKKRNSRRTNKKKRLTNKRRTNKKRLTKRR
jgi:bisphosphoglycerate-dependent phosphoglycerate mutase